MGEKLNAERQRYLSSLAKSGWASGLRGADRWDAHRQWLVRHGLLERDGEGAAAVYRITAKGRASLTPESTHDQP